MNIIHKYLKGYICHNCTQVAKRLKMSILYTSGYKVKMSILYTSY